MGITRFIWTVPFTLAAIFAVTQRHFEWIVLLAIVYIIYKAIDYIYRFCWFILYQVFRIIFIFAVVYFLALLVLELEHGAGLRDSKDKDMPGILFLKTASEQLKQFGSYICAKYVNLIHGKIFL